MKLNLFDIFMRKFEWFKAMKVPVENYIIIRLDGKGFSKFTEDRFEKPFDLAFSELMIETAQIVMEEFDGVYAYTESDEISILLPLDYAGYDREESKIVSISAGIASSAFTLALARRGLGDNVRYAAFDSRVSFLPSTKRVADYFRWRQADAARCALNGWAYWTLVKEGKSKRQADSQLKLKGKDYKNELLFQRGINFNDVPNWQKRGTGIYWETYSKEGFNPIKQEKVVSTRRRLKIAQDLPLGDDYNEFVKSFCAS